MSESLITTQQSKKNDGQLNKSILQDLLHQKRIKQAFSRPVEHHYQEYLENLIVDGNQRFFTVGLFIYSFFAVFDFFMYKDYYDWLVPFRLSVTCMLVLMFWSQRKWDLFGSMVRTYTLGLCLCSFQINVSSLFMSAPYDVLFSTGCITLSIFALAMLRFTVKHAFIYLTVNSFLMGLVILKAFYGFTAHNEFEQLIVMIAPAAIVTLVLVAFFGLFSIYSIESLTRKNWLQMQIMQLESQQYKDLSSQMQQLSETDGLTQLKNRRFFDEKLTMHWSNCLETKQPISLIMLDVDWFKKYNDTYGHPAGDACLKKIADVIMNDPIINPVLACRYGGEEFCVLLPEYSQAQALTVAESIRKNVEALAVPHKESDLDCCTVSVGVGTVIPFKTPEQMTSALAIASFIKQVDDALYKAKIAGKNCVVVV